MPDKSNFPDKIDQNETVTILSGATVSNAIELTGANLVALRLPAAFTGSSITIQESDSLTGTFRDVYDSIGSIYTIAVAASRTVILNPADLVGLSFIKLKSSSAEAADRSISVILRSF